VSGFGVSTGWWRAGTGVLAVDRSAAAGQHPSIRAKRGWEEGVKKGRAKRGSEEMGGEVIQLKICAIAGLY
jgi:hypothetical protein